MVVMEKYKLIKEYPGSGYKKNKIIETGFIWDKHGKKIHLKDYPEFWEEVVEKDYEIKSFKGLRKVCPNPSRICLRSIDGLFRIENTIGGKGIPEEKMLYESNSFKTGDFEIYSVKRLSDGEVFTVGDFVSCKNWFGKIIKFEIIEEKLKVFQQQNIDSIKYKPYDLKTVKKHKKPLFITEDGVDIFEGDKYFRVVDFKISVLELRERFSNSHSGAKFFSTKEAAEEYILINKPCLSISDIDKIMDEHKSAYMYNVTWMKKLNELVKSKL